MGRVRLRTSSRISRNSSRSSSISSKFSTGVCCGRESWLTLLCLTPSYCNNVSGPVLQTELWICQVSFTVVGCSTHQKGVPVQHNISTINSSKFICSELCGPYLENLDVNSFKVGCELLWEWESSLNFFCGGGAGNGAMSLSFSAKVNLFISEGCFFKCLLRADVVPSVVFRD